MMEGIYPIYLGERQIFTALYYGIFNLDPATVEWPSENKFTALDVQDHKIFGKVLEVSNGLPTVLEWHIEDASVTGFVMEYKYDAKFDLPYYPSEIQLYTKEKGQKEWRWTCKILMLKTSATPLEKDFFDPKRYFVNPPSSQYPRVSTSIYSNNNIYDVKWVDIYRKCFL